MGGADMAEPPTDPGGATAGPSAATAGPAAGWGARRQVLLMILGIAALIVGSSFAGTGVLGRVLEPPFPLGLPLALAAAILGTLVVLRAVTRAGGGREDA